MSSQPLISVSDLSHTFGAGEAARVVLDRVSVDFHPGEIVIVMGPSGAGKTTFLTLVGALRGTQSGSIRVGACELCRASPRARLDTRRKIGFIFQHHNLLSSLTALENVQMGIAHLTDLPREEAKRRASEMLQRVGLAGHGHKRSAQLSGGQRQRVAITRALVRQPSIILADEPTAALDSRSGREIVELLQKLAREEGCAILLVTHDNRILDIADRMLTLEDGHIEESHCALERLDARLADILTAIAGYPALRGSGDEAGWKARRADTAARLIAARQEAVTLASRKLNPALTGKTARLEAASSHLQHLDSDVPLFLDLADALVKAGADALADPLLQSVEFLLLTASDAWRNPLADDLEQLGRMTADRGEMMSTLRRRRQKALESFRVNDLSTNFSGLTDLFARIVYFIHALACGDAG